MQDNYIVNSTNIHVKCYISHYQLKHSTLYMLMKPQTNTQQYYQNLYSEEIIAIHVYKPQAKK
uniref:Uncharacterized protein n=1 Tax=Arundo donax TaxID=35708 RepID=A0A0A9EK70_ARUDO